MHIHIPFGGRAALIGSCLALVPVLAHPCEGPREVREASPAAIKAFVRATHKSVLTLTGYSGAEYEDREAMLTAAARVLDARNPAQTLINISGTAVGIGAVYDLAKEKGFTTMGIVSSLARKEGLPLAKCADFVFYVNDKSWGGRLPGSHRLSPTSATLVDISGAFVAIGGGAVTRDEMLAARRAGKPVDFIPADLNHRLAREKARQQGLPEPTDFRGAAHVALAGRAPPASRP